jgi:hypothetical protein
MKNWKSINIRGEEELSSEKTVIPSRRVVVFANTRVPL